MPAVNEARPDIAPEFRIATVQDKQRIVEILQRVGMAPSLGEAIINWGGKAQNVQVLPNSFKVDMQLKSPLGPKRVEVGLSVNTLFEAGSFEISGTGFDWGTEGKPPRVEFDSYTERTAVSYQGKDLDAFNVINTCLQINHAGKRYLFLQDGSLLQLAR